VRAEPLAISNWLSVQSMTESMPVFQDAAMRAAQKSLESSFAKLDGLAAQFHIVELEQGQQAPATCPHPYHRER